MDDDNNAIRTARQKAAEAVLADPNSSDVERMAAETILGLDEPDDDETGPTPAEIEFYSPDLPDMGKKPTLH